MAPRFTQGRGLGRPPGQPSPAPARSARSLIPARGLVPVRPHRILLAQDTQVQLLRLRRRVGAQIVGEPLPEYDVGG